MSDPKRRYTFPMTHSSSHHRDDRYDVSGNPEVEYMDAEGEVMKNKKGIMDLETLQIEEEKGLAVAYERLLAEVRSDTPMTSELIRYVHRLIFGDLYEWAGRWRTVRISKPGAVWPPPDFLDQAMEELEREVLQQYPASILSKDEDFCRAVGHIQGEFLAIHPFREGNARTIKLITNLLAVQTGRVLLAYDASEKGQERYIAAAKEAMMKNYDLMIAVIQEALTASRRPS